MKQGKITRCKCVQGESYAAEMAFYKANFTPDVVLGIHLHNPLVEKASGRYLKFGGTCPHCHGMMLAGTTFCDYRTTGAALVQQAIRAVLETKSFGKTLPCTESQACLIVKRFLPKRHHGLLEHSVPTVAPAS